MRIISILDIGDTGLEERIFRTSAVRDVITFCVFLMLLLGCTTLYVWYLLTIDFPFWGHLIYLWFAFWLALFVWFPWSRYRACLGPANWLVRAGSDRILVKFRSFQNAHYPENDPVVIELSWHDIDWVRKTKETSYKPGIGDGSETLTEFFTYFDIKLRLSEEELKHIESGLKEERSRRPLRSDLDELYHELLVARREKAANHEIQDIKDRIRREKTNKRADAKKSGSKYHDYPVQLIDAGILRIRWNAVKPNIKTVLNYFSQRTQVEPELKFKTDSTGKDLMAKELDDMILDRVLKGDKFDAMDLLKKHRGYSTTKAKQFIEELAGNSNKNETSKK